jgi:hypothetical protein
VSERRIVFWGLGGLRWARLDRGPFGPHWESGSVGGWIGLDQGLQFGLDEPPTTAIHPALTACEPVIAPHAQAAVAPSAPGTADAPVVPEFPEVVRGLARWMAKQLGGPGLLVIPPGMDRDVLWEWADLGWRLEVLATNGPLIAFDGPLVRLHNSVTAADGALAAALSCADQVVKHMVELAGGEASLRWHDGESSRQGWFARQQVALHLARGERQLGGQTPVFAAGPGLERLHRVRVQVTPPEPHTSWWGEVDRMGLLPSNDPLVQIEGPETRPELGFHLDMAGRVRQMLRVPGLFNTLGEGKSFDELFPAGPLLPEPPPPIAVLEPEPEHAPEPEPEHIDDDTGPIEPPPLPPFDPGWIELPRHREGSLSVHLDGQQTNADLEELAPGILRIQRPVVPHGAVLRVDFEPTWRRS